MDALACPGMRVMGKGGMDLPIQSFQAHVHIQLSTAFVTVVGSFHVSTPGQKAFEYPIGSNVTVSGCSINSDIRSINTCVLSQAEIDAQSRGKHHFRHETVKLDKNLFYLPFEVTKKDDKITVVLTYYYNLPFDPETGRYTFMLPSKFDNPQLVHTNTLKLSIFTASPSQYVQYGSSSHLIKHVSDTDAWMKNFEVEEWQNKDFEFSYGITTTDILATCISNAPGVDKYDPRATFCVNLHPPPDSQLTNGSFGRRVVFLIDVSGSMGGDPIAEATSALSTGLSQLRHFWDHFTVIAFNSHLLIWSETIVEANPASVQAAIAWVGRLEAKGGTDILLAVKWAADMLNNPSFAGDNRLPMVFMLTDGAVANEKAIHSYVLESCQNIRFHTLGIGDYANAYFLKMLAMAGRGLNDHIVSHKNIYKQMLSLIRSATTPILTNIEVLLPVQSDQYEIFPYPIPDLFCGQPLMISGKVSVNFDHALVRGLLPNGQVYQVQVKPQMTEKVLLHKVFARQRLDYMIGQAWAGKIEVGAVVSMSKALSMPTPYTVMVAYQKDLKKKHKHNNPPSSAAELAAISVGGVILLTGLALTLGDVAGTLGGIADAFVPDPFGPGALHGGGSDCCEGCCRCCNDPCWDCCRPDYQRRHPHQNTAINDTFAYDTWYISNNGYYNNSGSSDGCCDCCDCCNCGSGDHCGDCNACCCHTSGDDANCDCCGCDGGCDDCCKDCSCDCCAGCDCNCDGCCSDCNCDCGGCDCNCDCGGGDC